MLNSIQGFDQSVLTWIDSLSLPQFLNKIMITISATGNSGLVWILICIALLFFKSSRKAGITGLVALLLSLIICNILLKTLVSRPRPDFEFLITAPVDFSFPSGHTSSSFAAATVFLKKLPKKLSMPLLCYAVLMAFSRLYLTVHYPTDIFAGAITGIISGLLAYTVISKLIKE